MMSAKKGLVIGIANKLSIAWIITERLLQEHAVVGVTFHGSAIEKRVRQLAKHNNIDFLMGCDVTREEDVTHVCRKFAEKYGTIDFLVHSVAHADGGELSRGLLGSTRNNFLKTIDVSTYSLIEFCRESLPYFTPDASVLSLSYLGANRVCHGYNVMGVAKAALNTTCRYLAWEMGEKGVRINIIAAGPLMTSSAMGLPNFKNHLKIHASRSPLRRSIRQEDVANSALYFLSNLSSGVTGTIHHVDCGYHAMGTWPDPVTTVSPSEGQSRVVDLPDPGA